MTRVSMLGLLVGSLALVLPGVPVVATSASLAQVEGEIGTTADEDAAEPDSSDEGGGTVADPHGPAANDDAEEDEPGASTDERNQDENDDEGAGTNEAASRTPAWLAGGQGQDLEAL
jgi:hypothetical protein